MAVFQESSALAASQRFSGETRLTRAMSIVAEFPDRCRRLGEQTQQTVGNARHRPGRRGALPHVAPQQPFVAGRAPRLACRDHVDQRRDVGEAEVEALAGERMDDVRGVADQHPARPAPRVGAAEHERPGGALGAERQRADLAAGGLARARCSNAGAVARPAALRRARPAATRRARTTAAPRADRTAAAPARRASETTGARRGRCGRRRDQPRGDRALPVVAVLEAGAERVPGAPRRALRNARPAPQRRRRRRG